MKRRHLLRYSGLGLAGLTIAACSQDKSVWTPFKPDNPQKFGTLEKPNLTLGFVPTTEATPLIIAQEKGFFSRYGLTVKLVKQANWEGIEQGLRKWQFDAAHSLFSLPLQAQLSSNYAPIISLMMLHRNGSAITLNQKAWKAGIRPSPNYITFREFADNFRNYLRKSPNSARFALASPNAMESYLIRYWLGAIGIDPENEVNWSTFAPSQLIYKLKAGMIDGYTVAEPWNQQAVQEKAGFTVYVNRDIWQGHPGTILATMSPWVEKNPVTAKTLVAAVLEACQFSDQPENRSEIAQILAKPTYLNLKSSILDSSLIGKYNYENNTQKGQVRAIPDLNLFHYQATNYLKAPNQANYPWRSHGIWLLTQMIRWQQVNLKEYPKNADQILDRAYPVKVYEEVAKVLKVKIPSDRLKVEPSTVFVDHREFDPSQPTAYLNRFEIRVGRPQFFA